MNGKNTQQKENIDSQSDSDSLDNQISKKNKKIYEKSLVDFMPEANPLQPKVFNSDFDIYTGYPTQFDELPEFNKLRKFNFQDPCDKKVNNDIMNPGLTKPRTDRNITLHFHYQTYKENLVYSRYHDYNLEKPTEINEQIYFATYVVPLKKFLNSENSENYKALSYQKSKTGELINKYKIKDGINQNAKNIQQEQSKEINQEQIQQQQQQQQLNQEQSQKLQNSSENQKNSTINNNNNSNSNTLNNSNNSNSISQSKKSMNKKTASKQNLFIIQPPQDSLHFESRFESGNLFCAYKISEEEYDLVLQNDINTKGNTQWFFFSVKNMKKGQKVRFNLLNMIKPGSLFNEGLCPCVFSQKRNEILKDEWVRDGYDIKYYKSNIIRDGKKGMFYYTLTFSYEFQYDNDTVYFAHSYPYTATDLYKFLNELNKNEIINQIMNRKTLCKTLAGNNCEMLIITDPSLKKRKYRKGVVITARQHPGETGGSHMMQGLIEFLTGNSKEALFLRQTCIFKIVPMINLDGVIHGNYRTSLAGCDLNRQWKKPKKKLQPEVFFLKELVKKFKTERNLKFIIDLHGHSRKMNAFLYGCQYKEKPVLTRLFPYMLSKTSKNVTFKDCRFNIGYGKEGTARVALWNEVKIPNIFTLEASFFGSKKENSKEQKHFTIQDFKDIGKDVCISMYNLLKEENIKNETTDHNKVVNDLIDELSKKQELMDIQNGDDSGSDSCPSEDELAAEEVKSFLPKSVLSKKQKKAIEKYEDDKKKKKLEKKEVPPPPEPKKMQKQLSKPIVKPKEKEKPVMVDACIQTDTSFLQEYRAYLINKKKQQQMQKNQENIQGKNANPYKISNQINQNGSNILQKHDQRNRSQYNGPKFAQTLNNPLNQNSVKRNIQSKDDNKRNGQTFYQRRNDNYSIGREQGQTGGTNRYFDQNQQLQYQQQQHQQNIYQNQQQQSFSAKKSNNFRIRTQKDDMGCASPTNFQQQSQQYYSQAQNQQHSIENPYHYGQKKKIKPQTPSQNNLNSQQQAQRTPNSKSIYNNYKVQNNNIFNSQAQQQQRQIIQQQQQFQKTVNQNKQQNNQNNSYYEQLNERSQKYQQKQQQYLQQSQIYHTLQIKNRNYVPNNLIQNQSKHLKSNSIAPPLLGSQQNKNYNQQSNGKNGNNNLIENIGNQSSINSNSNSNNNSNSKQSLSNTIYRKQFNLKNSLQINMNNSQQNQHNHRQNSQNFYSGAYNKQNQNLI